MSDPSLYATRADPPKPTVELNAPIDVTQADCMALRTLVRGWIAEAHERVRLWEPRPCPEWIETQDTDETGIPDARLRRLRRG